MFWRMPSLCVRVCVCVFMCVCVHVLCLWLCLCLCLGRNETLCVSLSLCKYTHVYIYIYHFYTCMCACLCQNVYIPANLNVVPIGRSSMHLDGMGTLTAVGAVKDGFSLFHARAVDLSLARSVFCAHVQSLALFFLSLLTCSGVNMCVCVRVCVCVCVSTAIVHQFIRVT